MQPTLENFYCSTGSINGRYHRAQLPPPRAFILARSSSFRSASYTHPNTRGGNLTTTRMPTYRTCALITKRKSMHAQQDSNDRSHLAALCNASRPTCTYRASAASRTARMSSISASGKGLSPPSSCRSSPLSTASLPERGRTQYATSEGNMQDNTWLWRLRVQVPVQKERSQSFSVPSPFTPEDRDAVGSGSGSPNSPVIYVANLCV
jgi:hypothetical protein